MRNKRIFAFIIDMIVAIAIPVLIYNILCYFNVKFVVHMVMIIGWTILIVKDCLNGMSLGKRLIGIQVIDTKTKQVASPSKCITRNLFYFIYLIDVIYMFINEKNLRLGDYVVHTEVALRNKSLPKVAYTKAILPIGYVLMGVIVAELFYYYRATALNLL